MPYLGHATMVKVLRALIIPFGAIFVLLAIYDFEHGRPSFKGTFRDWQLYTAGLAFTFALSGLGWTECGNDYTRYVAVTRARGPSSAGSSSAPPFPRSSMMILGAVTFTFFPEGGSSPRRNGRQPLRGAARPTRHPEWVVVIFLIFAIVQLFGINSLDLYSSGVSLQAMGLR